MAFENPITFTEAAKIIGCMNMVLADALREGELVAIRGDWNKIEPHSFRAFCLRRFGIQIDRLPEKRRRFGGRAAPQVFTKKAAKKMKRKTKAPTAKTFRRII